MAPRRARARACTAWLSRGQHAAPLLARGPSSSFAAAPPLSLPLFFLFPFFFCSPPSLPPPSPPTPPPQPPQRFFETFSYLPPLSDADIAKQVDYVTRNGWVPALEFADPEHAYVGDTNTVRIRNSVGYQDNRYWSMYKLPMFGCTDSSQVLKEIQSATKSFPKAYIRLVAFDPNRQVQVAGMLVHRPTSVDIQPADQRSI